MNQLKNKSDSSCRFCSPAELIRPARSLTGKPLQPMGSLKGKGQTIKTNGNGNARAVIPDLAVIPAKHPARGSGGGEARLENNRSESARRIEQSIAYMREHLDQPMLVAKLAALASVSPSHFFALFKRLTGCPPIDYFIRLRMQHARELLDAGSLHVKEVAAALGYEDPFYFSRVFKAVNRIPPSRYQALQKKPSPVLRPDKIGTAEGGPGANGTGAASVSLPGNGKNHNSRIVHSL